MCLFAHRASKANREFSKCQILRFSFKRVVTFGTTESVNFLFDNHSYHLHKSECELCASNISAVKYCLPAFLWNRFHLERPHDLPDGHGRVKSVVRTSFGPAVKVFLKLWMQI